MAIEWTATDDGNFEADGDRWDAVVFDYCDGAYMASLTIGNAEHQFRGPSADAAKAAVETFLREREELARLRKLRDAVLALDAVTDAMGEMDTWDYHGATGKRDMAQVALDSIVAELKAST